PTPVGTAEAPGEGGADIRTAHAVTGGAEWRAVHQHLNCDNRRVLIENPSAEDHRAEQVSALRIRSIDHDTHGIGRAPVSDAKSGSGRAVGTVGGGDANGERMRSIG